MRVETTPKQSQDRVRNTFLDRCHRAMDKGKRTQDKFAGFVAQYCHETGAKGPKCYDDLSFNTLPQDIQLQFVRGSCPSDTEERLDCLHTIIAAGDAIEFRGNVDQLCDSTFPLMKSGLLVLECLESRYYSVESMSAKPLTSHLCLEPTTVKDDSSAVTRPNSENSKKQEHNVAAMVKRDSTAKRVKGRDRDDKGNSDAGKENEGKGGIQSEVPTKAPVQVASPTLQNAHPSHEKRAPTARPTGFPKNFRPTTLPLDPVRKFESAKTVHVTSFLPTPSPIQNQASDNSSSTILNLPTQSGRSSHPLRSSTGSIAIASGAIFMSAALVMLLVRARILRRKPHRRDDPALYVDVSISSERSCIYDAESYSGSLEGKSPQPKRLLSLWRWSRVDSCRTKTTPSASRFDDPKRVFTWTLPQAYFYASTKTPQSDQGTFSFPPSSPYLVEEQSVSNVEKGKTSKIFGLLSGGNRSTQDRDKRQLLNRSLSPTARPKTSIGSPRRKWQPTTPQRLAVDRNSPNDNVPTHIEGLDILPWSSRKGRLYAALVDESDGYADTGETSQHIASTTGDFHRISTDVSDEESVGSLAFLSPDIIKQFQEVDQRLSEGFKEFNEVDDRISQEFHKVESSLEKACEVADVHFTTAEETVDRDNSRLHRTVEQETSEGPLDTSMISMSEWSEDKGESIGEEVDICEHVSSDDDDSASVNSAKEVYEFNQLRDHFANSWYRRPKDKEQIED